MLLLSAAKAAAVAAVGSVALSSGRNMLQTYRISSSAPSPLPDNPTTVKGLQTLSRHELLKLYLHTCQAPRDLEQLNGDWNGVLLQNGFLLTAISRFVANRLFGKGRRWNGKSFDCSAAAAAAAANNNQVASTALKRFRKPKTERAAGAVHPHGRSLPKPKRTSALIWLWPSRGCSVAAKANSNNHHPWQCCVTPNTSADCRPGEAWWTKCGSYPARTTNYCWGGATWGGGPEASSTRPPFACTAVKARGRRNGNDCSSKQSVAEGEV